MRGTDFESEPVADVASGGLAEVRLDLGALTFPVDVDVFRSAHADVAGEERDGPFHDPAVVNQVQALKQTVIGHLPLQLGEVPSAFLRQFAQLVGQRPPKRGRRLVRPVRGQGLVPLLDRGLGGRSMSVTRS